MPYNNKIKKWVGYIYLIQNDIKPEKYYVGQTVKTIKERWYGHIYESKEGNHTLGEKIHKAMLLYGSEHFFIKELLKLTADTKEELITLLDNAEIEYIQKYDSYYNGYNSTKGGRGAAIHSQRKVNQYDLNGKFVNTFESVDSIKGYLNIDNVSSIYSCCYHETKYAYGFIWKYYDDEYPLPILTDSEKKEAINRRLSCCEIYQYDYNGNLINKFKNIEDVIRNTKYTRNQIMKCCIGVQKYIDLYTFRFSVDPFNKFNTVKDKPKFVEQYTLDGKYIATYVSAREAGRKNNINYQNIVSTCMHVQKKAGGYCWRYAHDNAFFNFEIKK